MIYLVWELSGKRAAVAEEIAKHRAETRVRLKVKPSRQLLVRLLDQTKVKEILLTPGILKTMPTRVRAALEKSGLKLSVMARAAGRPAKYAARKREEALHLIERGKTAADVAKELGVPTTAIYYWSWAQKRKGENGKQTGASANPLPDST